MKKLALLLLFIPLAFAGFVAGWQAIAGLSVVFSSLLIGILYAVGFGFDINELKITAKEEMFQLIAMGVMLVVLVGANGGVDGLINAISTNGAFAQGYPTLQDAGQGILQQTKTDVNNTFNDLRTLDTNAAIEASRAGQCSILGMGYSVSGCGGFSMLATPLSMAGGITGFALTEVSAMYRLIDISKAYALGFLLPLGILLRTFKITRGAGGFLIALGVSLHIMLPAGVVFNDMLLATFNAAPASGEYTVGPHDPSSTIRSCNSMDTGSANEDAAIASYTDMRQDIRAYMDIIMIHATLGPVISILMLIASLRALTSIMGAEVDVSGIARFA